MPTKRALLLIALLSLPAVALLAWWGIVQLDLLRVSTPRWDIAAKGKICWGDSDLAGASPGDPLPQPVSQTPPGTLAPDRAALMAQYAIHKYVGGQELKSLLLYGEGPTLVQATFPDGARRLAWRRISLISEAADGMSGVAVAVYLETATGQPLALVRGIYVCEPSWSPLFQATSDKYFWPIWLQTSGQFFLLGLYVAVVLFIVGVVFGLRRLRARPRPPA